MQNGRAELRSVRCRRAVLGSERLPQTRHGALGNLAHDVLHVAGAHAVGGQHPSAQSMNGCVIVPHAYGLNAMEGVSQRRPRSSTSGAKSGFTDGANARNTPFRPSRTVRGPMNPAARHQRRADARLRRPAGVHPFGPGAFGEVLDDPGRHASGNTERRGDRLRRQAKRRSDRPGCRKRTEHGRRMEPGVVCGHRRHETEAAHQLDAGHDADEQPVASQPLALARRNNRRNDHRAGVHGTAFERIVEILAMGGGAVDEGRAERVERPLMTERGARALVERAERCHDVGLASCRDAQARDVEEQSSSRLDGGLGQVVVTHGSEPRGNCFSCDHAVALRPIRRAAT